MSDKGYLPAKVEKYIARLGDAAINFDEVMGERKILGVIKIGSLLERKDFDIFLFGISMLDDTVIGKNPKPEVKAFVDSLIEMLENEDWKAISETVAGVLANKIQTPFEGFDQQIFQAVLMMFNGLFNKAVQKAKELAEKQTN